MKKVENKFTVMKEAKVIKKIGKSTIEQPKIQFKGGEIKWFDDSQLLKK